MRLVRNEQIKLMASALDRLSTVCMTIGVAALLSAFVYGSGIRLGTLVAACYIWTSGAVALHWVARQKLRRLEE